MDRLAVSPALAGPELTFLRARIAERRGDVAQAATLVIECLKEQPGNQEYLDFAVEVDAELPPRAAIPARQGLNRKFMIVSRNEQILFQTTHDHGRCPKCLNIKFRHNGA
jgi:hypothetical protein